jgi:uncharacterized protein (TIRG00374 family)
MSRWNQQLPVAAGFLAGFLVLVLFGWFVGPAKLIATVGGLDPGLLALALVAVAASFGFRYLSLMVLLDAPVSPESGLAFLRGTYAKFLLPGGGVAAPLLTAYSMRRATGVSVDRGLAATLVAEGTAFVGSTVVALLGSSWLVLTGNGSLLPLVVGCAVVLLVELVILGAFVAGLDIDRPVLGLAAFLNRTLGRFSAAVERRTAPAVVADVLARFSDGWRLIRDDPARLAASLGWAVVSWGLFSLPVVGVALALDVRVPLAVAFVVVPISDLLHVLPTPGGVGGVELALAGALAAFTGMDLALAAVVAFCYRLCTYWFVLVLAGAATTVLSIRSS